MSGALVPETLWLAPTRPAMRWGVPLQGFLFNAMGSFMFGMAAGSPLYWGVFVVVHLPMRALAAWDANVFRVLALWMETKGAGMGKGEFGASALVPLGAVRVTDAREYPVLV